MTADPERRARPWRPVALAGLLAASALAAVVVVAPSAASAASPGTTTASTSVPTRASSGCLVARPSRPGTTVELVRANGDLGAYFRQLPPSYTGRTPLPVVFELHGYGVSAEQMAETTLLGTYGDQHGFITITPQVADRKIPYWQTGFKSNDVAFLRTLLNTVDSSLCVDQNRTYVTGYSNGAVMASVLACVDAGQVAAIAPVSGIANPAHCNPSRPVPVVAFHGTADPLLSYTGGFTSEAYTLPLPQGAKGNISRLLGANVPQGTSGPSIPKTTSAWAKRDGCAGSSTTRVVAKNVALISYACPNGGAVELYRIRGGGHTWPGSAFDAKIKSLGSTTTKISADKIIWTFFTAHPLGS